MRSHFAIGRPLADTQKLSMALHCYELSVRHALPDKALNSTTTTHGIGCLGGAT